MPIKTKIEKAPRKRPTLRNLWAAAVGGAAGRQAAGPGKPKGELRALVQMAADWRKVPNTLLEDETGQLWLAYCEPERNGRAEVKKGTSVELVDVAGALTWLQNVSELCDGWSGDVADVCRIALGELARRPAVGKC